MTSNFILTLVN